MSTHKKNRPMSESTFIDYVIGLLLLMHYYVRRMAVVVGRSDAKFT